MTDLKARLAILRDKKQKSVDVESKLNEMATTVNNCIAYRIEIENSKDKALRHEKELIAFRNKKRQVSLEQIQHAVNTSCYMVTGRTDYYLSMKDKRARIVRKVNQAGKELELPLVGLEGDGLASLNGVLLQSQVLGFNSNTLPLLILDEAVSPLSEANKEKLSELLSLMQEDYYIVGIEQYASTYNAIAKSIYEVSKEDEISYIRKVS